MASHAIDHAPRPGGDGPGFKPHPIRVGGRGDQDRENGIWSVAVDRTPEKGVCMVPVKEVFGGFGVAGRTATAAARESLFVPC